jgi:Rod binding domain-containing protein
MSAASPANWYDFKSLSSMQSDAAKSPTAATKGVAQQFESIFINMMLTEMRKTVGHSELTGSAASDTYQEMFDQQVSLSMSKAGGIGLAPYIEKQLNRVANANQKTPALPTNGTGLPMSTPSTGLPVNSPQNSTGVSANPGLTLPVTPTEYALKSRILDIEN